MRSQQGQPGKGRRVGRAAALVSAVVAAISLGVASPALADTYRVSTTGAGAVLSIFTYSSNLKLCDTVADGKRAMADVSIWGSNGQLLDYYELVDANGANGQADADCDVVRRERLFQTGDTINYKVWIQDGTGGPIERAHTDEIDL
ncbi:hypothetical protein [Rugosimonospora africana]|uniref:Secreted protein n=1 Tax=Rugosimonospora africana TaxID=556532 RepID=A0A8J3QW61_9ACTN|nr:hypothetical protein [Rugosimonospora africana]GIH16913.1 hypothetical protein Raf01_50850 [Rugosimonospora africana]